MLQKLHKSRGGFTLVEIMIVVAIIALLAAIAVPGFIRARKRSQATRILEDLRLIDAAIDQYAIETNKKAGDAVNWTDIKGYLKPNSQLYSTNTSVLGIPYITGYTVDQTIATPAGVGKAVGDVAPQAFWDPFTLTP
jgi:prepilin-type N-terminal cleavage/methylation domain-containing protein